VILGTVNNALSSTYANVTADQFLTRTIHRRRAPDANCMKLPGRRRKGGARESPPINNDVTTHAVGQLMKESMKGELNDSRITGTIPKRGDRVGMADKKVF